MADLLQHYLRAHELSLVELDRLLFAARNKGLRRFSGKEIERLGELYLQCLTRLSQLQTREAQGPLPDRLNRIAASAHTLIYSQPAKNRPGILSFFTRGFPRSVAGMARPLLLAFFLLALGVAAGFWITGHDPSYYYTILPGDERTPGASRAQLLQVLRQGRQSSSGILAFFATSLFVHNTQVGLTAWVTGILFGIPTLLLAFYNGLILGAMTHVYWNAGLLYDWGAWILPHGVTELLAILLCTAGGLHLGLSLIAPGDLTRGEIVKKRGMEALRVGLGTFPMFLIAALIEGFIRQSVLTDTLRYGLAGLSFLAWTGYFASGFFLKTSPPVSNPDT